MRRFASIAFGLGIAVMIAVSPFAYRSLREHHLRNFRTVRPDVFYRSGQLSHTGLQLVIREYGIRTVITLRDADSRDQRPPDWAEEQYCRKMDIHHFRLPPRFWWDVGNTGAIPAEENVRTLLQVLDDPKYHPILIHCFAGSHRTGAYCAIFRMEFDRWDNQAALDELRQCGYVHVYEEKDVLGYLRNYQPRWKKQLAERTDR